MEGEGLHKNCIKWWRTGRALTAFLSQEPENGCFCPGELIMLDRHIRHLNSHAKSAFANKKSSTSNLVGNGFPAPAYIAILASHA